ncbi:RNA-binding protein [Candida orthopsilosis Co 90-125]|uniref:RNA-binding protein n=1 Tax=Candida orthopsilosis (strain 90-125) TaxID=1136231 RepID=H8WZV2_CANO9|nr:RNA-binding protein [Candida orthopsilosis Co 90-125]CCG22297.1 RNA-binding protein [Candida orthopsilosis Co 90-125]
MMYQQVFYNNINRNGGNAATPLNLQRYTAIQGLNGGIPPSPMTPLDMSYGQSMLPSNLFVSTPYFTPPPSAQYFPPVSHHSSLRNSQTSLTNSHGSNSRSRHRNQHRNNGGQQQQQQQQVQVDQREFNGSTAISEYNLGHLNISRNVMLRDLANDMTLHELLDHIDFGPIEYIKLFSKNLSRKDNSNDEKVNKSCSISFINSKTSVMFYLKYAKNSSNLNKLRQSLRSDHLKITLNDVNKQKNGNAAPRQDYMKLKNLNYITDHQATRCLKISFSVKDVLSDDTTTEDRLNHLKHYILTQCEKFGDVECFEIDLGEKLSSDHEGSERGETCSNNTLSGAAIVHFTSIDSSVKTYESYHKRIQTDLEKSRNGNIEAASKKKRESSNDLYDVNSRYGIYFTSATFHKDRCDKTLVEYRDDIESGLSSSASNGKMTKNNIMENGGCDLIVEEGPLDNSSEVSSIIDSPGQNPPIDVNIIDPVSPNSSDIENSSPIIRDTYALSHSDHADENEAHAQASNNSVYSMISSDARQLQTTPQFVHIPLATDPSFGFHSNSSFVSNYNPDPTNTGNRAIHLGNLHPHTTIEEIANNLRAGGLVESLNHFPERRMCFVTFVDANIAFKFFMNHQVLHQLVIHGTDVSVGWAKKHSGPVSREIALAVTAGASRNVYLGLRNGQDDESSSKLALPSEEELRLDFSRIGGLEQINFYHNKECAFLNFLNISDAIKVVRAFECEEPNAVVNLTKSLRGDQAAANALYQKYKLFKVNFGKDRCGNPPKFSFKKNFDKSLGSTYQQYQDQLHACVEKSKRSKNRDHKQVNGYDENSNRGQPNQNEDVIDDEAAMVFGIIKESEKEGCEPIIDNEVEKKEQDVKGTDKPKLEVTDPSDLGSSNAVDGEQSKQVESEEHANGHLEQQSVEKVEVVEEGEEEYEDVDDDEDVSIIIGSDDTVSTNASGKYDSFNDTFGYKSQRPDTRRQKIYHQPYYQEQTNWNGRGSRNSSGISINNGGVIHPYTQFASPKFNHHPSRMSRNSSTSSFPSQGYQPSPKSRNGSFQHQPRSSVVYPQQVYAIPPSPQFIGQFTPHVRYVPVIQGQQVMASPLAQHSMENNSCGTSGSQVMAQYLSQAQTQPMGSMYSAPIYAEPPGSYTYEGRRHKDKSRKG